jgi:quinol-cytochrome oxidoreductase complex cytochrome b subunit
MTRQIHPVIKSSGHPVILKREILMNWNKWMRQLHRWLSVIFTLLVLVNIVINVVPAGSEQLGLWVGLSTLLPLFLLLFTGLYLFVLPYTAKRRSGQGAD